MMLQCLKKQTIQDPIYDVNRLISRAQETMKKMLPLLSPLDINLQLTGAFE